MPSEHPAVELSLIIPVYNEAGAIRPTVEQVVETLGEAGLTHEVVLVDDGSTDGSSEEVARLADDLPTVRTVVHERNRGYGAALKTGIFASLADVVAITDADGTYPNERLPELYRRLVDDRADMVVGARTGENVNIPWTRRPAKAVLRWLANYLSGHRMPDLNSGLRVMRKQPIVDNFHLVSDGFSFTTTTLLALMARSRPVVFVPIDYHPRKGNSKIRPIADTFNFVVLILRTCVYFEPLKVFLPVSMVLAIAGVTAGVVQAQIYDGIGDMPVLLLVSALQIGLVGLIADMISRRH